MGTGHGTVGLINASSARAAFIASSANPDVAPKLKIVAAGQRVYKSIPRIFHTTIRASLERSVTTTLAAWKSVGVRTPFALPISPELLDNFAENLDNDLRFEEIEKHIVLGPAFVGAEQRRELLRYVAATVIHARRHKYSAAQSVMLDSDCDYIRTELFDENVINDYNFRPLIPEYVIEVEATLVEDEAIEEDLPEEEPAMSADEMERMVAEAMKASGVKFEAVEDRGIPRNFERVGFEATREDLEFVLGMAMQTGKEIFEPVI